MIFKGCKPVVTGIRAEAAESRTTEAIHMIGTAIVTGSIAAILVLVAIPVSLGLGMKWGMHSIGKKFLQKSDAS